MPYPRLAHRAEDLPGDAPREGPANEPLAKIVSNNVGTDVGVGHCVGVYSETKSQPPKPHPAGISPDTSGEPAKRGRSRCSACLSRTAGSSPQWRWVSDGIWRCSLPPNVPGGLLIHWIGRESTAQAALPVGKAPDMVLPLEIRALSCCFEFRTAATGSRDQPLTGHPTDS